MEYNPVGAQIYSFTEDAQTIELDELSASLEVRDSNGGTPRNRPVQAWELMNHISNFASVNGVEANLGKIYVKKTDSKQVLTKEEKFIYTEETTPLNKWLFNRIISQIHLPSVTDSDTTTSIAISYNDKGIAVGFGENVKICQNMSILGASHLISNYGNESLKFESMLNIVQQWILDSNRLRQLQRDIIERMKDYRLPDKYLNLDIVNGITGKLLDNANIVTYFKKNMTEETIAPLNITQCSEFSRRAVLLKNSENPKLETIWDLYNIGTEILRPMHGGDYTQLLQSNVKWLKFLNNELNTQFQLCS